MNKNINNINEEDNVSESSEDNLENAANEAADEVYKEKEPDITNEEASAAENNTEKKNIEKTADDIEKGIKYTNAEKDQKAVKAGDTDMNKKSAEHNKNNKSKSKTSGARKLRVAVASVSAAIFVVLVAYCIYVNSYDSIMPNTYIEDINLGGMSQQEAFSVLASQYSVDKLEGKTMNFSCMGDRSSIEVKNLAMQFEPEKMASDAYSAGREKTGFWYKLITFTSRVFSRHIIRPSLSYDEQALKGSISDLCTPHEREPLGYTFRIGEGSNIVIAKPQDGIKVNVGEAVKKVEDEICTFRFGDVDFVPVVTQAPKLNIDDFYNYITGPAQDASYAKDDNGKVYVVPGKPQIVVNKSDIEAAIKQPQDEYIVPVQLVNSAVDASYLQSILYEDTLGTYSTDYSSSSASRASNIRTASGTINGIELLPGEDFDFNKVVGKRTAERGYQQAPVYVVKDGKTESEMGLGGGICQVSSTIYCAVARANLKVVARTSHSKEVNYVPKGMDATVSWGGPEFIFRNSTDYPIRVLVSASGGILSVRIVGSTVQKPDVKLDVQNDGSSVIVTRITTSPDGTQTSEVISSKTPPLLIASPTAVSTAEPVQTSSLQ